MISLFELFQRFKGQRDLRIISRWVQEVSIHDYTEFIDLDVQLCSISQGCSQHCHSLYYATFSKSNFFYVINHVVLLY